MKKIFKILNMDSHAWLKIAFLMLLYVIQAVLQVAQPEVLNQATIAVEAKSPDMLMKTLVMAAVVTAGTLVVDALIKLKRIRFENVTLELVQRDLMQRIMRFKRVHFKKSEIPDYLTGVVDYGQGGGRRFRQLVL